MTKKTKEKTYDIDILCSNCNSIIWVTLPYGKSVKDYLIGNKICPKCGCNIE